MMIYLSATLIGVVAGLRTMTAPAAVSWAAYLGWIKLQGTWLAFLGFAITPYIITFAALAELVTDQLPSTPSRKVPVQFGARIVMGGLCGLAIGGFGGLIAAIVGAVIGTLAGAAVRARLTGALGSDRSAALLEDAVAIGGAAVIVTCL